MDNVIRCEPAEFVLKPFKSLQIEAKRTNQGRSGLPAEFKFVAWLNHNLLRKLQCVF